MILDTNAVSAILSGDDHIGEILAEADHQEAFDEDFKVRTCDVGRFLHGDEADKRAFARELGAALREIGFAILEGHGERVLVASFRPDGDRVVTAGFDRTARVWDVHLETRKPDEITAIVNARVPWRIVEGRLVLRGR